MATSSEDEERCGDESTDSPRKEAIDDEDTITFKDLVSFSGFIFPDKTKFHRYPTRTPRPKQKHVLLWELSFVEMFRRRTPRVSMMKYDAMIYPRKLRTTWEE